MAQWGFQAVRIAYFFCSPKLFATQNWISSNTNHLFGERVVSPLDFFGRIITATMMNFSSNHFSEFVLFLISRNFLCISFEISLPDHFLITFITCFGWIFDKRFHKIFTKSLFVLHLDLSNSSRKTPKIADFSRNSNFEVQ